MTGVLPGESEMFALTIKPTLCRQCLHKVCVSEVSDRRKH